MIVDAALALQDLQSAMQAMAPANVMLGCRRIGNTDDQLLSMAEAASIVSLLPARRQASGAARHVARQLLRDMGSTDFDVLRGHDGAPLFPQGFIGSLAHDDHLAVAALARSQHWRMLGIDIEPSLPLPEELVELVIQPEDNLAGSDDLLAGRILFAVKEAVYKASFPSGKKILNYDEIHVDLARGQALTSNGYQLRFRFITAPAIVALAFANRD